MIMSARVSCTTQNPEDEALLMATEEYQEKVTTSPFLYLTLDLPTSPLFQVSTFVASL